MSKRKKTSSKNSSINSPLRNTIQENNPNYFDQNDGLTANDFIQTATHLSRNNNVVITANDFKQLANNLARDNNQSRQHSSLINPRPVPARGPRGLVQQNYFPNMFSGIPINPYSTYQMNPFGHIMVPYGYTLASNGTLIPISVSIIGSLPYGPLPNTQNRYTQHSIPLQPPPVNMPNNYSQKNTQQSSINTNSLNKSTNSKQKFRRDISENIRKKAIIVLESQRQQAQRQQAQRQQAQRQQAQRQQAQRQQAQRQQAQKPKASSLTEAQRQKMQKQIANIFTEEQKKKQKKE